MKLNVFYIFFLVFAISANAQIDSKKKSGIIIPATEGKKDSSNVVKVFPSKTIKSNPASRIAIPKTSTNLNIPKKKFSMFPQEKFGNPGELYEKRIDRYNENIKKEAEVIDNNGSKVDQFFGDFKTKSKYITIVYRDFGEIDGDVINVLIDEDIVRAKEYLTGSFRGFKLDLKVGSNRIDFFAVNQGLLGPNTAQFKIIDELGNVLTANMWNLAKGVKGTVVIFKE